MRVEGGKVAVGFGQELRPIQVVRSLHVDGIALGGTGVVGNLEVSLEILLSLVVLHVGIVDKSHIVVCHGIGIIGVELQHLGEISPNACHVEVAFHSVQPQIEIDVGIVGIEGGKLAQLLRRRTVATLLVVFHRTFHPARLRRRHLVGQTTLAQRRRHCQQ